MGKVFTWGEVERNEVPKPADFDVVVNTIRRTLAYEPSVIMATLFGSVVSGTANIRSDIDCFVFFAPESTPDLISTLHNLHKDAKRQFVSINFVPCDSIIASTHMHLFGPLFREHLIRSAVAGGYIKADVVLTFAPSITPQQETEEYLRAKMYRLQEAYTEIAYINDEQRAKILKKSLEAPMHIARKMLGVLGFSLDGTKQEILHKYELHAPWCLVRHLRSLTEVDAMYTRELEHQLHHADERAYRDMLQQLAMCHLPETIAFVRGNILWLSEELA